MIAIYFVLLSGLAVYIIVAFFSGAVLSGGKRWDEASQRFLRERTHEEGLSTTKAVEEAEKLQDHLSLYLQIPYKTQSALIPKRSEGPPRARYEPEGVLFSTMKEGVVLPEDNKATLAVAWQSEKK